MTLKGECKNKNCIKLLKVTPNVQTFTNHKIRNRPDEHFVGGRYDQMGN